MRARQQPEQAERDQQRRRDREKGVVGERGREVGDVIVIRFFERALQDCE
jgi:hypothetical protein